MCFDDDFGGPEFDEGSDIDNWETEQVFQDGVLERAEDEDWADEDFEDGEDDQDEDADYDDSGWEDDGRWDE